MNMWNKSQLHTLVSRHILSYKLETLIVLTLYLARKVPLTYKISSPGSPGHLLVVVLKKYTKTQEHVLDDGGLFYIVVHFVLIMSITPSLGL